MGEREFPARRRSRTEGKVLPGGYNPDVCPLRPARGVAVITAAPITTLRTLRPAEAHSFFVEGTEFLYLVPSGSIFALEGISKAALDRLRERESTTVDL